MAATIAMFTVAVVLAAVLVFSDRGGESAPQTKLALPTPSTTTVTTTPTDEESPSTTSTTPTTTSARSEPISGCLERTRRGSSAIPRAATRAARLLRRSERRIPLRSCVSRRRVRTTTGVSGCATEPICNCRTRFRRAVGSLRSTRRRRPLRGAARHADHSQQKRRGFGGARAGVRLRSAVIWVRQHSLSDRQRTQIARITAASASFDG